MDTDIDKFCYGHITGETCDEYINHLIYNHLIKNGFIIKAPKNSCDK